MEMKYPAEMDAGTHVEQRLDWHLQGCVERYGAVSDRHCGCVTRLLLIEQKAREVVAKLDVIHADPKYSSVWTLHQLHQGPYTGPSYADELAALRAALGEQK